jgi:retron-type reverse transcriptase
MSKGITSTTLDGLKGTWFTKVAEDLKSGKFNFKPARRVLIPKPGKTDKRPIGIGSPRDKIIQKALQVVLEVIWEKEFLPSSFGFRPIKSIHQLLRQLHLKGSTFQ